MMHGGFGLTTCLWMLGIASVLSRIFFFNERGEREVALLLSVSKIVQKMRKEKKGSQCFKLKE